MFHIKTIKKEILMKHIPILRFSFLILLFSAMALQGKTCTSPVRVVCPTIDCGVNIVHISQADVGPAGYVISTPGRYCLIEDITWAPTASGTPSAPVAAISILSSNVELDLNGYVLSGPSNFTNNVGIKVGSDLAIITNVVIQGGGSGSVQNFTLGIFVDPVNNILIQDLSALNNGIAGSISSNGLTFVGGIAVVGNVTPSKNVTLRRVNTAFNGGVAGAIATYGTLLDFVTSALVENSEFNFNVSENNITYGLFLSRTFDVDVKDSQANDNSGAIGVAGFSLFGDGGAFGYNQLLRNTANENILGGTPPASAPIGQNVYFADGFYFNQVNQGTISDCVAMSNVALVGGIQVPLAAAGFEFERCFDCRALRCIAGDNFTSGIARGFHLGGNRLTCEECFAETNTTTGAGISGRGFDLENFANFGTPSTNEAMPNACAVLKSKAYGFIRRNNNIGIRLHNATNCVIDGNYLNQCVPVGILLDQDADCLNQQNVVKHNQIVNVAQIVRDEIGGTSFPGIWAIEDNTGSPNSGLSFPNNTYYDNYAFNYLGNANFSNYNTGVREAGNNLLNPGNTFITQWTVPGDPPGPTGITKLTNLDIVYAGCFTGIIPG